MDGLSFFCSFFRFFLFLVLPVGKFQHILCNLKIRMENTRRRICIVSEHYQKKRYTREMLILDVIGEGNVIDNFVVDRGHKNGPEIHSVTDTGVIIVYNQRSGKMVTKLIARPGQIRRYYEAEGQEAPQDILDIAKEHLRKGYNKI